MTGPSGPTAFLDASALYPALLRNILMRLASRDLFRPQWSDEVQNEWVRALTRDRPDLPTERVERTRRLMDENIADAIVAGYEPLIETITLPDANDRHVLAAAIHGRADLIVTANLRDFPEPVLSFYGIQAVHPDAFIASLFGANSSEVIAALRELRLDLVNPPFTVDALLSAMGRNQLLTAVEALRPFGDAL